MAIKIDLEVKSEEFEAFSEKFNAYHDALRALPEAWAKASVEAKKIKSAFEEQTEAIGKQSATMTTGLAYLCVVLLCCVPPLGGVNSTT